jgi:hypothetical protein
MTPTEMRELLRKSRLNPFEFIWRMVKSSRSDIRG